MQPVSKISHLYSAPPSWPTASQPATMGGTAHILASFAPISLAEMDAVTLLNRTDAKYVLTLQQLDTVLQHPINHCVVPLARLPSHEAWS